MSQVEGTNDIVPSKSSKIKCTIQLILQNNDDYLEIGTILVAVQNDQTFEDLINKSKKKINKKSATKKYTISYDEDNLSIYVRAKENNDIKNILQWPQVDFEDEIIDLYEPSDVIVFVFKTSLPSKSKSNKQPTINDNNDIIYHEEKSKMLKQMIPTAIMLKIRIWGEKFDIKQVNERFPSNITIKQFKKHIASKYIQLLFRSECRPKDYFINPSTLVTSAVEKLAASLPKISRTTINFYYQPRNSLTVCCQQFNDISPNCTVQQFCDKVSELLPITFQNKILHANRNDVTFQRNTKLSSCNFGNENSKNIFCVSGSLSKSYPLEIEIDEIDVDEKGDDQIIKLIPNTHMKLKINSCSTISSIKDKITVKMAIPFEQQVIYYKLKDKYIATSDDTVLSEIGFINPFKLYLRKYDKPVHLALDLFCNGYQIFDDDEHELLVNTFTYKDDVLYITPRWIFHKDAFVKESQNGEQQEYIGCNDNSSVVTVLRLSSCWMPYKTQTRKGLAALLSCLYVICQTSETTEYIPAITGHFRYLFPNFPPAILTLKMLLEKNYSQITPAHKAALTNACFKLFCKIIPQSVLKDDSKVFEYSHILFSYIMGYGSNEKKLTEKYTKRSFQCPLSLSQIVDPVIIDNDTEKVYSRMSVLKHMKNVDKNKIFSFHEMSLIMKTYCKAKSVFIWDWKNTKAENDDMKDFVENDDIESKLSLTWREMTKYVGERGSNKCMKIRPILSLKEANNNDVALTIDLDGNICAMMSVENIAAPEMNNDVNML